MMTGLAVLLLGVGTLLLVIAAWGVLVLPDALARQHAATKAGTLAVAVVLLGALLAMRDGEWAWRLALIAGFLLATLPVSSHLLARAALSEAAADHALHGAGGDHGRGGDARGAGEGAEADPVEALRARLDKR